MTDDMAWDAWELTADSYVVILLHTGVKKAALQGSLSKISAVDRLFGGIGENEILYVRSE